MCIRDRPIVINQYNTAYLFDSVRQIVGSKYAFVVLPMYAYPVLIQRGKEIFPEVTDWTPKQHGAMGVIEQPFRDVRVYLNQNIQHYLINDERVSLCIAGKIDASIEDAYVIQFKFQSPD